MVLSNVIVYITISSRSCISVSLMFKFPVCDSSDSLTDEIKYLDNVFNKNNYSKDVIRHNTYRNSEPNATNTNVTAFTAATIPYIKGLLKLSHRSYKPTHKPDTTLSQLLTNVKDKDEPSDRQETVYKIECCDWRATYIGESGWNLNIRLTENKRATRNGFTVFAANNITA